MKNILDQIPQQLDKEIFTELLKADGIRIERIVSTGQTSPAHGWYDQTESEWIILIQGSATIEFDTGETHKLNGNDFLNIPAHTKHKVSKTDKASQTIWLAVFY